MWHQALHLKSGSVWHRLHVAWLERFLIQINRGVWLQMLSGCFIRQQVNGFNSLVFFFFFKWVKVKSWSFWLEKHSVDRVLSTLPVWNNPLQGCENSMPALAGGGILPVDYYYFDVCMYLCCICCNDSHETLFYLSMCPLSHAVIYLVLKNLEAPLEFSSLCYISTLFFHPCTIN